MLKNVNVKGFKCIDNIQIQLENLNLLTGKNSSGKSTLIQAILLGMQNNNNKNPLNNKYVELGEFNDIKNSITGSKQIEINFEFSDGNKIQNKIYLDEENMITIKRNIDDVKIPNMLYISANRTGVLDSYQKNLTYLFDIGIHCEFAFDYLSRNKDLKIKQQEFIKDKQTAPTLGHQVNYWLNYIVDYEIVADMIEDVNVVRVRFINKENKLLRPQHVGTGVSYIAQIIIAALSCKKDDILIIENPEIHLHPKAQSKVIEFLAFLASNGLQIIIETHSDHIFNGIRKAINKKQVKIEQSKIYFCEKDEKELSNPIEIKINENGTIQNPKKGLFDQFDEDLDELLGW